ncbi:hypothetical protein WA026_003094 [Henosepilachna vigintioctopunctata]|uniref:V-type proton ATPase subunit S1 n=1 Tax=Henosepilachna vigintioctopunctata TaxID=420089 RepID=A0AAW1TQD1_9CUCU
MFSRHDSIIFKIQSAFFELRHIIFGVYTGRQSWIIPEISEHFKSKKLLQNDAISSNKTLQKGTSPDLGKSKKVMIDDNSLLLVVSDDVEYSKNYGHTFTTIILSKSDFNVADKEIKFSLQGGNLTISFSIMIFHQFWTIDQISLNEKNFSFEFVGAPIQFSYHCSKLRLENHRTEELVIISGFQIQPFKNGSGKPIFGTPIDCTGFTTIIIWNVMFVVGILLSILFFGVASMMDIKTMDRFEDPQKKPFHVIAED